MSKRKNHASTFRAKVAPAALFGEKTVADELLRFGPQTWPPTTSSTSGGRLYRGRMRRRGTEINEIIRENTSGVPGRYFDAVGCPEPAIAMCAAQ